MRQTIPIVIVLALLLPASAVAGTALVSPMANRLSTLSYTAAPGERNRITLTLAGNTFPFDIVVRDAAAAVVAGPGCRALDERAVRCADPVINPSSTVVDALGTQKCSFCRIFASL